MENYTKTPSWNVFVENVNKRTIVTFDIFSHIAFTRKVLSSLRSTENKEEFAQELKRILRYFYWAKAEWEVIITSWPAYVDVEEFEKVGKELEERKKNSPFELKRLTITPSIGKKVDIYEQIMLNFHVFLNYLWNFKEILNEDDKIVEEL